MDIGEGIVGVGIEIGDAIEERTTGSARREQGWTVVADDEVDGDDMPTLLLLLLLAILRSRIMPGSRPPLLVLPFDGSIFPGATVDTFFSDRLDAAPCATAAGGPSESSMVVWSLTFIAAPN